MQRHGYQVGLGLAELYKGLRICSRPALALKKRRNE